MKNILITGGAGFIGSNLADRLLLEGFSVTVIDNFSDFYDPRIKEYHIDKNLDNKNYKLYRIDIEDKKALKRVFEENKIDMVVHLAARAGVRESIKNPDLFAITNILGTVNVLEMVKEHGIKKMIFGSSSSIYGNCREASFSEDLVVSTPISPYAATKSACEQFCYTYSKLYDIQILCLRFFTVYGPRQRPDLAISKFVKLINEGKPVPVYGDGSTIRDYTYVDDIVSGITAAISYNDSTYEIINLGGGAPLELNEMIGIIEKELGKKAIIERLPMQAGDVKKTSADITKAKKLLGFEPKTAFKDGIKKFAEWRSRI